MLQVQNLIERCLQLYMTRKDVVNTLQMQAKIEPDFTLLGESTGSLTWGPLCPPARCCGRGEAIADRIIQATSAAMPESCCSCVC